MWARERTSEMSMTEMKIKSSLIPRQPDRRLKFQFCCSASECRRIADVMVSDKDSRTIWVRMCEWRDRLCEINPRLFQSAKQVSVFCSWFSSIFSFLQTKIPINLEHCVKHKFKKNIFKRLSRSQARTGWPSALCEQRLQQSKNISHHTFPKTLLVSSSTADNIIKWV